MNNPWSRFPLPSTEVLSLHLLLLFIYQLKIYMNNLVGSRDHSLRPIPFQENFNSYSKSTGDIFLYREYPLGATI